MIVSYGDIQVPWAAMWSEEAEYFVGMCPWFKRPAICQREAQGQGTPVFGQPHANRQRKLHALGLCDICAKPLKNRTKISMSNFGGADRGGMTLTQSEPLSHVECARLSLDACPSLRRQATEGRLRIRKVFRFAARASAATPEERARFVPNYTGPDIIGLAVIDLTGWRDITGAFLDGQTGSTEPDEAPA